MIKITLLQGHYSVIDPVPVLDFPVPTCNADKLWNSRLSRIHIIPSYRILSEIIGNETTCTGRQFFSPAPAHESIPLAESNRDDTVNVEKYLNV